MTRVRCNSLNNNMNSHYAGRIAQMGGGRRRHHLGGAACFRVQLLVAICIVGAIVLTCIPLAGTGKSRESLQIAAIAARTRHEQIARSLEGSSPVTSESIVGSPSDDSKPMATYVAEETLTAEAVTSVAVPLSSTASPAVAKITPLAAADVVVVRAPFADERRRGPVAPPLPLRQPAASIRPGLLARAPGESAEITSSPLDVVANPSTAEHDHWHFSYRLTMRPSACQQNPPLSRNPAGNARGGGGHHRGDDAKDDRDDDLNVGDAAGACNYSESVVICVSSGANEYPRRQAVRRTWARSAGIRVLFFFGRINESLHSNLVDEAARYEDIVQYDFKDDYRNLTLKSVSMLRFIAAFRWNTLRYFIKADDDTFVNVPMLMKVLAAIHDTPGVFGAIHKGARPNRQPKAKWYVPRDEFPSKRYPSYVSGCFYIIPIAQALKMNELATRPRLLRLEDAYITGLLADAAHVPRYATPVASVDFSNSACWMSTVFRRLVAKHYVTPAQMLKMFAYMGDPTETIG